MTFKRIFLALVILALLVTGYFAAALNWSYSSGERAGWIQKLSHKGWLCKTWEGELALVSLPGSATVEKFLFTVHDDAVAAEITDVMGKRVTLHYEEKVGLPTSCFGETRHYVTKVSVATDISLSPGVVVQTDHAETTVTAPAPVPAK
ncbi:6-phosphogluconate dehydrogenase [soil metagenome]